MRTAGSEYQMTLMRHCFHSVYRADFQPQAEATPPPSPTRGLNEQHQEQSDVNENQPDAMPARTVNAFFGNDDDILLFEILVRKIKMEMNG